jgi:protein TonB
MEKNKSLLNQSGCLSREAVLAWLENRLSPAEKTVIDHHLQECILCREALEGFESSNASRVRSAFAEINTNMQQRLLQQDKKGLSRRMKLSLAAAVLLMLIGVFSVFKFRPIEKPMEIAQEINQPKFEPRDPAPAPVIADEVLEKTNEKKPETAMSLSKEKIFVEDKVRESEVVIPSESAQLVMESPTTEQKEEKPADEVEAIVYNAPTAAKRTQVPDMVRSTRFAEKSLAVEYTNKSDTTYYAVDSPPKFQNGDSKLFKTYVESKLEINQLYYGKMLVSFILDKNGKVKDVFVVEGLGARNDSLVKEIVLQSPKWQPARQNGKAVNVQMVFEVFVRNK